MACNEEHQYYEEEGFTLFKIVSGPEDNVYIMDAPADPSGIDGRGPN